MLKSVKNEKNHKKFIWRQTIVSTVLVDSIYFRVISYSICKSRTSLGSHLPIQNPNWEIKRKT